MSNNNKLSEEEYQQRVLEARQAFMEKSMKVSDICEVKHHMKVFEDTYRKLQELRKDRTRC